MERAPRFESAQTRDAVAQVLDYGSFLETLTNDDLITLITSQSGGEGIEDFRDGEAFEEWYNEHKSDSLDNLRPVRMVLVGLGVDDRASRIVKLLRSGIDISLLTFHSFSHDGATILARHVRADYRTCPRAMVLSTGRAGVGYSQGDSRATGGGCSRRVGRKTADWCVKLPARPSGCCPSTSFRPRLYAMQGRIRSADYSKFDPINVFLDFLPPKFTLLRIVSGLEAPDRGRVERQLLARFSKLRHNRATLLADRAMPCSPLRTFF